MAEIPIERQYENAIDVMYSAPYSSAYEIAAHQFKSLGNYRDSADRLKECRRLSKLEQSIDPILLHLYISALELELDGFPQLARLKFELVGKEFRFAHHRMLECKKSLKAQGPPPKPLMETVPDYPILREAAPTDSRLERIERKAFYRLACSEYKSSRRMGAFLRHVNKVAITAFLAGAGVSAAFCSAIYFLVLH